MSPLAGYVRVGLRHPTKQYRTVIDVGSSVDGFSPEILMNRRVGAEFSEGIGEIDAAQYDKKLQIVSNTAIADPTYFRIEQVPFLYNIRVLTPSEKLMKGTGVYELYWAGEIFTITCGVNSPVGVVYRGVVITLSKPHHVDEIRQMGWPTAIETSAPHNYPGVHFTLVGSLDTAPMRCALLQYTANTPPPRLFITELNEREVLKHAHSLVKSDDGIMFKSRAGDFDFYNTHLGLTHGRYFLRTDVEEPGVSVHLYHSPHPGRYTLYLSGYEIVVQFEEQGVKILHTGVADVFDSVKVVGAE
jgi:hypothetical protein